MQLLLAIVAVLASGAVLTGCGGGGGNGGNGGSTRITGVVVDQQTSEPIPGATIRVGGRSAQTNDSGSFELGVPAGTLELTITAPGYQSRTFSAVADEGLRTNVGVLTLLNADNNPPAPPI
jgi:hypothetical protein